MKGSGGGAGLPRGAEMRRRRGAGLTLRQLLWVIALVGLSAWPIGAWYARVSRESALYAAATTGDAATTLRLLNQGIDPDAQPYRSDGPALWWAVSNGSVVIVQALLDHGANPNGRAQWSSVIDQATRYLNDERTEERRLIAEALLARASRIRDPEQRKELEDALAHSRGAVPATPVTGR